MESGSLWRGSFTTCRVSQTLGRCLVRAAPSHMRLKHLLDILTRELAIGDSSDKPKRVRTRYQLPAIISPPPVVLISATLNPSCVHVYDDLGIMDEDDYDDISDEDLMLAFDQAQDAPLPTTTTTTSTTNSNPPSRPSFVSLCAVYLDCISLILL